MADSPIDYLTLADLCERWHVKQPQIAAVALEGKLTLSIPVPGVHAEFGYTRSTPRPEIRRGL
jgi:hypothetical protein